MKTRWSKIARLSVFAVVLLLLSVDIITAWVYVEALTHPPCFSIPPSSDFPTPEHIQLKTTDGIVVPAWYYPSQNGAAIISLSGLAGAMGSNLPYVDPLLEAGYGVLQIGSRACATPAQPVTIGANEVKDAAAGLEFLLSQNDIDPARIGIYGFSMGGVGAIRTAAYHPEISAVLAEGGYYNLGDDIVEPDSSASPFRKIFLYTIAGVFWIRTGVNPWQVNPVGDIGAISPRPVLLIYGEHEVESGRAQLQFDAANEPKELWIVPGGGHGQNYLIAPEDYEKHVMDFFEKTIGGK